jgi:type II secretory pathway pseudopilin PulG
MNTRGFMLIEVALVVVLMAIILGPVLHLLANQREKDKVLAHLESRQRILESVEGFVLATGRLPCPSSLPSGTESRNGDACLHREGWLPLATLATWGIHGQWKMAVATLEQAGEPAQNALVSAQPFAQLSPQQLTEIVMAPYTANYAVGMGPLPAIHLCQVVQGHALPQNLNAGCGAHTLLNATTVWLAYLEGDLINQNRYQQFFINPDQAASNPVWLSFERMNWLWMKRGALDTPHIQEN